MSLMPFASQWPHSYLSWIGIRPPFTTIPGKQEEPQEYSLYPVLVLSESSPHRRTPKTKVGQEVAALLSQKSVGSQGSGSLLESHSSTSGSAAGLAEQVSHFLIWMDTLFHPLYVCFIPFHHNRATGAQCLPTLSFLAPFGSFAVHFFRCLDSQAAHQEACTETLSWSAVVNTT